MTSVTQDYQAEVDASLLMGNGTAYDIVTLQGLGGMPGVHTTDVLRLGDHGAYLIARDLVTTKVVNMQVDIIGTDASDLDAKIKVLRGLWVPQDVNRTLRFKFKCFGYGDQVYRIDGSSRRCAMDLGESVNYGIQTAYLSLECQDPRVYSDAQKSHAGSGTCNNAGVVSAPPLIVTSGGFSSLTLTNTTTGLSWSMTYTMPNDGSYCTIDMLSRTVIRNNGVSLRRYVNNASSKWWFLVPGNNSITVTGASCTTYWRDAFL